MVDLYKLATKIVLSFRLRHLSVKSKVICNYAIATVDFIIGRENAVRNQSNW